MLASDTNNPNFVGAYHPDSLLHIEFFMKSDVDSFKSEKEGRPIYYEIPYVRITTPGNGLSIIEVPAREDHKQRFPIQWARFQNSHVAQDQIVGTPLEQWPIITRSQAEELRAIKFFTVEQIAGASDMQVQRLGMNGNMLKQKAQAFLSTSKDTALAQKQAVELAKKDQEIAELRAAQNRLAEQMEQLNKAHEVKPKRKYTRRQKTEDVSGESADA